MPCYNNDVVVYTTYPAGCATTTPSAFTLPLASDDIFYAGPNLTYITVNTLDTLSVALQKIDNTISTLEIGGLSLTNGNGTTANVTAVDLGGTLTADVNIDGYFDIHIGSITPLFYQTDTNTFYDLISGDTSDFYAWISSGGTYDTSHYAYNYFGVTDATGTPVVNGITVGTGTGAPVGGISIKTEIGTDSIEINTVSALVVTIASDSGTIGQGLISDGAGGVVWGSAGSYTFSQGITETAGTVALGGTITGADVAIDIVGPTRKFSFTDSVTGSEIAFALAAGTFREFSYLSNGVDDYNIRQYDFTEHYHEVGDANKYSEMWQTTTGTDFYSENYITGDTGDFSVTEYQGLTGTWIDGGGYPYSALAFKKNIIAFDLQIDSDTEHQIILDAFSGLALYSTGGTAGADGSSLKMQNNQVVFALTGTAPFVGYDLDYSADYTNRSFVDKEYVDTAVSDIRLKQNIVPILNSLSLIEQLKPCEFDFIKTKEHSAGFIAQELEEVFPAMIVDNEYGIKKIKRDQLIPYLVKAIQELSEELKELKKQI